MANNVWIYDIETYPNIFTFVFKKVGTPCETVIFEMSSRKNQLLELISFLKTPELKLVGYNCIYFDYPILHFILTNKNISLEGLYNYVQYKVIGSQFPLINSWNIKIPQCDLYKINHYDNQARRTSLKWLEFTLRWKKLQDLPFKVDTIIPEKSFDELIEYNINDVEFTHVFYEKCLDAIRFRQEMSIFLKKNVMNFSDVKIGEHLNKITYSKLSGLEFNDFKNLRTKRDIIHVRDLIPKFVKFKTKKLSDFLSDIKTKSFKPEQEFERHISIGGISVKFAKGGLHSEDTPKVFKCKKGYYLKEKDVGSMYPKAIIAGGFYPQHLGKAWCEGIKILYEERVNELKPLLKKLEYNSPEYKSVNSKQEAYKLAMNGGGYGKTGSQFSWQNDLLVMYKVAFRGQLSLIMLLEEYAEIGVELVSANTDGIVIHYPQEMDNEVQRIHDNWETMTDSILEDTFYNQIIFRDVNNYIADILGNKIKYKGCFEIDQEFHKNNSQRIVAIALKEYFINNVPIKDVICNLGYEFKNSKGETEITTIFDYCRGVKKGKNTELYAFISPNKRENISDKVIRFYISNSNTKLYKIYDSEKVEAVGKGFYVTSFMNYEIKENYDINFNYYINECYKIIKPINRGTIKINYQDSEQLKLF